LSARYRCCLAKPFHDVPPQIGRLSWGPRHCNLRSPRAEMRWARGQIDQ
jgi:hypothetical protein